MIKQAMIAVSTKNSRRGSVITEAAMVMPVVILAVMSVLVVLLIFHQRTEIKTQLHREARSQAGQLGGVWWAKESAEDEHPDADEPEFTVRQELALLFPTVRVSADGVFGGLFLLAEREEQSQVSAYVVKEAQLLRNLEFALEKGELWLGGT